MEDAAAFLVDTSDNMILSHRSSALVGSTLESAASDPLMQSVAEKLDAGDLETTILNGYQVTFEQVDASNCVITSSARGQALKCVWRSRTPMARSAMTAWLMRSPHR